MKSSFWRRLLRQSNGRTSQRKQRVSSGRVRLSLECLEARTLLSADMSPFYLVYQPQSGITPMNGPGPSGMTPSQIEQAYGFNQITFTSNGSNVPANGSGQTIAIVDAYNDPTIASDLQAFDVAFGLPSANLTVVNQNGGTTLPGVDPQGGWEVEESLDVEWAHAIAPGAKILFVEANSSNWSDLETAVQTAAAYPGVAAVSLSWGGGEFQGENTSDNTIFVTPPGHSGVVFVASSGDSGAPVSYPAISPNVLAVGGTTLSVSSTGNYQSESAWSGSGGGISSIETLPSYQPSKYSNGATTGTSNMRMNPDVAYDANPSTGFPVYDSYNYGTANPWQTVGGTSDAAPQWAALIAITDQGRALQGESALDGPSQLLPTLYKLPGDFHDITSGTSTGSPNYTAGAGYDLTTGLGTPIANYLVTDLISNAAPATPTGLTATAASSTQINLSWNSVTGAHNYTLERSTDNATWQVLATANGTSYSDTGLQAATTYYYRIDANNGFGSSPYSASVSATTSGNASSQFSDPGFETPSVGTGPNAYQYNPTGAPWTYSASSGVAGNGSAFTSGNPNAPQGTQVGFIQRTGTISQAVNFSAGTYTISFDAAQRGNFQASSQTIQVLVDGTLEGTFTPSGTGYSLYTTNAFTVTAGTHTVSFVGLNPNGGDNTAFLDQASIATATSPPPSPPPATNAFNDPDFATPNVGTGTNAYEYNPAGAPWTYSTHSGVAGNGSAFTSGNPNAPVGTQVAFIQGTGTISQTVTFTAGSYTISFDAAQRANNQSSYQNIAVEVDGTIVGTIKPANPSYSLYTTNAFTVPAGTHTVSFVGLNPNGGDNTAFLDNAGIATATSPPPPASNQFSDPDFATPNVGTGTGAYMYNPSAAPWTYSTSSGVAGNGSAFTAGNPNAPVGTQVAFIQGTGTISQTVTFTAGTFTISFDAAQRANYQSSSQTIEVEVDGTVVATIKPTGTSYALYTTGSFTVTAGTHTVSFVGLNPNGGDNTAFLDNAGIAAA